MEIREDSVTSPYPVTPEEMALAQMMFEKITELRPDWPMGDRTDLAMTMFAVVKKWAHKEELTTEQPVELQNPVILRGPLGQE